MPRIGAFLSLLLALTFISLAFAPVVQPVRAETDWDTIGGTALVGAGSGALAGGLIADGPGAVVGAVVGGVWGAVAGYFMQDRGSGAAYSGSKGAYAEMLANTTANYLALAHEAATNDIANYETMSLYYARKAEWAALQLYQEQEASGTTHTYDPYYVLSKGEVANGTMAIAWKIAAQYEAILNSNAELASSFVGTYDGMSWNYAGDGRTGAYISMGANSPAYAKVGYHIGFNQIDSTNTKYATFSAGSPIYIINQAGGTASGTVTITARDGTVVYNEYVSLPGNRAMLVNVPVSGEYNIKMSGGNFKFFGLCSSALSDSYTLTGMVLAFANDGGMLKNLMWSDGLHSSFGTLDEVSFNVGATYSASTSRRASLESILDDMDAILPKIRTMNVQANSFAQAYYNTLVSSGGGANRVMPDIIFPDPDALENLTAEGILGIYYAYLSSMQDWFSNYSVMDPNDVNISIESLNLKVRGSIYYANGTLAYANTTIFTPYVSLQNMHLTLGRNNMTQPGFAVIWGTASSLADFHRLSNVAYHSLSVGDYIIIEEMALDNKAVTSTDLTVHTVQYSVLDRLNPITPPQGITDAEWLLAHWYWFALILGVILCLAWVATRNTAIGVIGLVLVAVGAVFWIISDASVTTGLLSGLFQMKRGGL